MTGTIFNSAYFGGIVLSNAGMENPATIASGVYVGNTAASPSYNGDAVYGKAGTAWTVVNNGTVVSNSGTSSSVGIDLESGGNVTNAGTIVGQSVGVQIKVAAGTIANFATIVGSTDFGVFLYAGGSVTNGHSGSSAGLISGANFGVGIGFAGGTVANFATITGSTDLGVYLTAGGTVTNGYSGSSAGLISGNSEGVAIGGTAGTVANFATIAGSTDFGVHLYAGGSVTNGHSGSSAGLISGGTTGVEIKVAAGTVANFATITGSAKYGVYLGAGGQVTNGHSGSSAGLISGNKDGVEIKVAAGTVANFATIAASTGFGVYLLAGGSVTNGHSGSSAGLISGQLVAVEIRASSGTVVNFATIAGSGFGGVFLLAGGSVTNGHSGASAGLISGGIDGVLIVSGAGAVANFGTISGATGYGVYLGAGGSVTNGESGSIDASISGSTVGVYANATAAGTVANFGIISGTNFGVELLAGGTVTVNRYALISGNLGISIAGAAGTVVSGGEIDGSGGTAIQFGTFNDTLILGPTAVMLGKVDGGAGNNTLELRAGAASGTVMDVVNFGLVTVDPGASWTVGVVGSGGGQSITGSGGVNRLVFETAGTLDLSGVFGFPTIVLAGPGANSISLGNANFIGLTSNVITVNGGDFGNTVDASALSGTNRVILIGGKRADHFTGGAGNDIFEFSSANLSDSDTVKGGAGSNELLMTSAGTITASGVSAVETFKLASGVVNHLSLTSANFTGVTGHVITIDDGNSGNTVGAATLPSSDSIIVHVGAGTDTLTGGAGGDIFYAGGKTKMTGGGGANRFTFAHIGSNTITDFAASSSNMIVLRDSGFNLGVDEGLGTGSAKHLAASVFVANSTGSFTTTGQRFAYNTTTGALRYSHDGSGSASSAVVVLSGHPSLSAGSSGQVFFTS